MQGVFELINIIKLKQVAAKRTRGLAARLEPLVQTNRVKQLSARAALLLGQLEVGAVYDIVADGALLHAAKLLVHILLPDLQTLNDRAVLVSQVGGQLDEPVAPLLLAHTQSPH